MRTKGLNRKAFLKGAIAGLAGLLVGRLFGRKARAAESMTGVNYYEGPAIGQPGYEDRVAKLFAGKGVPDKATRIT